MYLAAYIALRVGVGLTFGYTIVHRGGGGTPTHLYIQCLHLLTFAYICLLLITFAYTVGKCVVCLTGIILSYTVWQLLPLNTLSFFSRQVYNCQ